LNAAPDAVTILVGKFKDVTKLKTAYKQKMNYNNKIVSSVISIFNIQL